MKNDLEANKRNAIAFYRTANPVVADGKQPFIDYFTDMATQYPGKKIEFVRAVAEGDLVALHTHQTWPPR